MARQTAPRTEPRIPLSRERVLRAAIALADEGGIEALSMRKLAKELGVEAMSLYNHVANKDDILDGIVDPSSSEIDLPDRDDRLEDRDPSRSRSRSTKRFLRHPWASSLWMSAPARYGALAIRGLAARMLPERGLLEGSDVSRVPHHRELHPGLHGPGS